MSFYHKRINRYVHSHQECTIISFC